MSTVDHVLLFSPALLISLSYQQGGMHVNNTAKHMPFNHSSDFKTKWYVTMVSLEKVQDWDKRLKTTITLPPHSFTRVSDIIPYLNHEVKDFNVSFKSSKNNYLTMDIDNKDTTVEFSNTLRDIFAFDKNEYRGIGSYRSSDVFSLTRRIQFLYLYSNISDYVRVGNTEAPLLAVIPFQSTNTCGDLVEKSFNVPMYVHVSRDFISQIDIYIYDGSGELVPFTDQAVTSIRLHYRKA